MNEDVKAFLYRAISAEQEIQRLIRIRQEEYDRVTRIVAQLEGTGGGTPNPHKLDRLAELDDAIQRKLNESIGIRTNVELSILRVPEQKYRDVLIARYLRPKIDKYGNIKLQTWEHIADATGYSYRYVQDIHKQACRSLKASMESHGDDALYSKL